MRRWIFAGAVIGIMLMSHSRMLRCEPAKETEADRIGRLIKQLGDNVFAKREMASRELETVGEPALPALRKAATASDDAELRGRAGQIIGVIASRLAKKELAKYQGTWQAGPDGTRVIIEADKWTWISPGFPNASGRLRVVEVSAGPTKVEWMHDMGATKGASTKAIMHLRDGNTLQYNGRGSWEGDGYPTDFKGIHACNFTRIPK